MRGSAMHPLCREVARALAGPATPSRRPRARGGHDVAISVPGAGRKVYGPGSEIAGLDRFALPEAAPPPPTFTAALRAEKGGPR